MQPSRPILRTALTRPSSLAPRVRPPLARVAASARGAALIALLAVPAAAQFNLFDWTLHDDSGDGVASVTADNMNTTAWWPTLGGGAFLVYETVVPVTGRVVVTMSYTTFDGVCGKSVPVFVLDGVPTILASCSGNETFAFLAPAGSTIGLGLQTFDGSWPGAASWTDFHFLPIPAYEPWTDLGGALAGSGGPPALEAIALLFPHFPFTLELTDAAPLAPAALIVGFTELLAPFKGGVLVPAPDVVLAGFVTDAAGEMDLATSWPGGVPSGLELYFQFWVVDATGPAGFSASNALRSITP